MDRSPDSTTGSAPDTLSAIRRSSLGIAVFAILAAGVIAVTQFGTKAIIAANIQEAQASALFQIYPEEIDPDLFAHSVELNGILLNLDEEAVGYQAIVDQKVIGVILPVTTTQGYSGDIDLLVGINADASIQGVRVVSHRETPGLGDNIELAKSDWILSFDGKKRFGSEDQDWAVKKDGGQFDQFTGATITPRAIVDATGVALDYFAAHPELLIKQQGLSDQENDS